MDLRPISPGLLDGRVTHRGLALTVTDRGGSAVVRSTLRADSGEADFETAEGSWRLELITGSAGKVLDAAGEALATVRYEAVVLGSGEILGWGLSGRLPRYR